MSAFVFDGIFIGTLGAALVLVFGVVLLTGLSLDRTQTAMVRFLAEKGVALVTALESGVRSGTRSRTGIRLQYLVEELADRPDVRFIAVTMPDGTILAHSNPARVGEVLNTRGGRELGAETIAALRPSETPSWAIIDMEGSRAFVVFKTFHPKIKGEGRQDEPTVGPLPYVFLGLDLAPLEVAQAQNRERAVLLGAGVLLAGMLALLGLHAVERVRSSRRGQRVAEALAEELAVALPDGLVVFDAKGRITRMNKAALTLLGMEAPAKGKAFLGRKPAEVLPSALAELAAKLLQEPVLPDTEIILRHGEEQQYISVRGGHVNEGYEGRLGSLMFLRDLTEVRRLEAEVRRREKLAAVGNLAAGVAHELRNPLSSIKGYATYLTEKLKNDKMAYATGNILIQETERLNRVMSDLLSVAKPLDLRLKAVRVESVLEQAVRLIAPDAEEKGVAVQLRLPPPGSFPEQGVRLDADRLMQALLNLLVNAVQATESGGGIEVALESARDRAGEGASGADDGFWSISISDTGCGMPAQTVAQLFTPYFTTKASGTGLGLVISQQIVEQHGGEIKVFSRPGKGTTFTILLPVAAREEGAA